MRTHHVSAAGASASRPFRPRLTSSGSFHAGDIIPSFQSPSRRHRRPSIPHRRPSGTRYHTFPAPPPKSSSSDTLYNGASDSPGASAHGGSRASAHGGSRASAATPLPLKQLGLLALLSLAEQTALNSISPYLPTLVASFDEIPDGEMGLYVGLLASAFALAQLATNLFWGYLSDLVGRKPVMLAGSFLLMVCFCFFGFCTTYWQVVVIHVAMGLLNGNAAVVPTCLGEVTDRTNQSSAFIWLPVMYSIGGITGPALGGLLAGRPDAKYPFLAPNIVSAICLGISVIVLGLWFEETLDKKDRPSALTWARHLFGCQTYRKAEAHQEEQEDQDRLDSSRGNLSPPYEDGEEQEQEREVLLGASEEDRLVAAAAATAAASAPEAGYDGDSDDASLVETTHRSSSRQLLNYRTILLLLTYLVFQVSNTSFNSLYPIFSAAPEPTGRALPPGDIGLLLSFAGAATIFFQVALFQPFKTRVGNMGTYRWALCGLTVSMLLMPWVGYVSDPPLFGIGTSEWWLYLEESVVLVVKNICAVGGLSSVMLLINNSAPSHETLGTLNGIAQTLSAAGRSFGPFLSGALFTLSTRLRPRGEMLAWGIFGGISLIGWLGSLVIEGRGLESGDWHGGVDDGDNPSDEERL